MRSILPGLFPPSRALFLGRKKPPCPALGDHVLDVVILGAYKKVVGVAAGSIVAAVEEFLTSGYLSSAKTPCDAVGKLLTWYDLGMRHTVTERVFAPCPLQASGCRTAASGGEIFEGIHPWVKSWHEHRITQAKSGVN